MNAIIVEKKTSPPVDGVLNIDTIHLSVGISIPYSIYKYWKKGKGDCRIRKVKSELGNLDLIYYNSSFKNTLIIELSVTKFLYGSNAHFLDWSRLPEVAARIQCIVSNEIGIDDLSIFDFTIKRLDLNIDHFFPSKYMVNKQMILMEQYYFIPSRNYKRNYCGTRYIHSCKANAKEETKNKSAVFKYYRKDLEIKSRNAKNKGGRFEAYNNPCIRYEITLPSVKLAEIFSKRSISLKDIINCNPIELWICGLRKIGSNLELMIMDKTMYNQQKENLLKAHKLRSKYVESFFDAIINKDYINATKCRTLLVELNKNGYQPICDKGFRNFQRPQVLS